MSKLLFPVPRVTYWAALALVATALIAPLAQADTVYTYTGNPFDNFGPSNSGTIATCPPICSISGLMVLASPIDFTDFRLVQVLSFSFTDQNTVLTSGNAADTFVNVAGDGFGNISQWVLDLGEGTGPVQLETIISWEHLLIVQAPRLRALTLSRESLGFGHRALWRLRSRPC